MAEDSDNDLCKKRTSRTTLHHFDSASVDVISIAEMINTITGLVSCQSKDRFDIGTLRYSAGVSAIWVSPFGLVSVSIAQPFGDEPGDEVQQFQFNFGQSF